MILLWRVTTWCNFACGFCAYDRRQAFERRSADADEIERVVGLVAQVAAQRGERLLVSWIGGEPLGWSPLLKLSERLARRHSVALSMTTNGTRLQRSEVRARILASFAELTLSIDGPGPLHDSLRGAKGSHARIVEAIEALVREREQSGVPLKLRANVVLMRATLPHFPDLCRMLADTGIDEITFNQLGGRDRPEFFPAQRLLPRDAEQLAHIVPALQGELAARGCRLCSASTYLDRIAASSRGEALPVSDCRPGEQFLFVDENGLVAPCSFTTEDYGLPTASLMTPEDIVSLAGQFGRRRIAATAESCRDCPSTQMFGKFAA